MTIECAAFGALGRDAERRTSKSGKPYLIMNVRVGNDDAAQWVSVLAFDPQAIEIADRFVKGATRCTWKAGCPLTNGPARTARNASAFPS